VPQDPPRYRYEAPPELRGGRGGRHPVVVVGAGPVGLCAAIDLAQRGLPVLLLDEDDTLSTGSRGLCYAKRSLEVLDRLGCGQPLVDKGVTWNVGRTFLGDEELFNFHLQPEPGHERPGMINLPQSYLEATLVERAQALPGIDLRWKHQVKRVEPRPDGVTVEVTTPDGEFSVQADWLIAADGARSGIRRQLGLEMAGKVFMDRFLIVDVRMQADFPPERRFWFDPPFHRGQSVLLHRQPDHIWRIDFQLGMDADPELEMRPERVLPRVRALLGDDREIALEWMSIYTFQCRRMPSLRHGRVLFAGDAAHQLSPFGARGANSGIQDADNLGWKLAAVIAGHAPNELLDSFSAERSVAADENIANSTRSTDFITPKGPSSRLLRDSVLALAKEHAFARALVNSGRLSVATVLADSPLNTPDADAWQGRMLPGAVLDDAPVVVGDRRSWLLREVAGPARLGFTTLVFGDAPFAPRDTPVPVHVLRVMPQGAAAAPHALLDSEGLAHRRCDARPGTLYLLRPDQHVVARFRRPDPGLVSDALELALCRR
jgi:3-(3-hydroxy-phenyl)propionate hydroxylase